MLIGLIADTHIPYRRRYLPFAVLKALEGVDLILHAGDINVPQVLDLLSTIAPVEAVAGNGDEEYFAHSLSYSKILKLNGYAVGITHGHLGQAKTSPDRAYASFPGADVIVFGHSHIPLIEKRGSTLMVNPGSPTDRRRQPDYTIGLLSLGETITAEIVKLN